VFPDVGDFQEVGVESGFGKNIPEGQFMHHRGAGRDDDPVEVLFLDVFHDQFLARI
jgi:hypothetical protein